MYVTNTSGCGSGGSWETYNTTKQWTLGQTNTTATVYVEYKNSGGAVSACVSDTIVHDDTAPDDPSFSSTNPSSPNSSTTPKVIGSISATDIASIRLYTSSSCYSEAASGTRANFVGTGITITVSAGLSTDIYAKAFDNAGNQSSCTYLTTYVNNGAGGSDVWVAISDDAPPARRLHTLVWTGSEVIVWGGISGSTYYNTGAKYNPTTDSWTSVTTSSAPTVRRSHTAVWTGAKMMIWGGYNGTFDVKTGGLYDPVNDSWSSTSIGTNVPTARNGHTAVWTGNDVIIWGGETSISGTKVNTGALYDPSTDSWTTTSTGANVPSGRYTHTAVWTGSKMIVWGGLTGLATRTNTGGAYDPVNDSWTSTSTGTNVPSARNGDGAVWTGTYMVIWGGYDGSSYVNSGGRYDPSTDSWTKTATGPTVPPSGRNNFAMVWTGTYVVVWGGYDGSTVVNSGGRYNPSSDSWSTTSTGTNVPAARSDVPGIWTGTYMVVWGGSDNSGSSVDDGGRYNPSTDAWLGTQIGRPLARSTHVAAWTGSEMIIWGGVLSDGSFTNTGAIYDPAADSWSATSTGTNVPAGRSEFDAVWTGTYMIVWGGLTDSSTRTNTGGRYNPSTDSWSTTSTGTNVPAARNRFTATWTGTYMVIFGGQTGSSTWIKTGGRYNPSTDSW